MEAQQKGSAGRTLVQILERKSASSIAESPPPITATRWFRKKKPSQVAQLETPVAQRGAVGRAVSPLRLPFARCFRGAGV